MNSNGLSWDERAELISETLNPLRRKWHSRIISFLLRKDSATFTELRQNLDGVSNKVLSNSLADLQENEIVEKLEDEDSEYRLTEKGSDLEPIFDEMAEWGANYLREDKVNVLIIEDNEAQAKMYQRWLEPAYDVETATNFEQAVDRFDLEKQVILLDRKMGETSAEEIISSLDGIEKKQIIVITGVEPGLDLLDLEIDDYLVKPIRKDDLKEAVRKIVDLSRRTEKDKELYSLLSKKSVLDQKAGDLHDNERYRDLVERIKQLKDEIDNLPEYMDAEQD